MFGTSTLVFASLGVSWSGGVSRDTARPVRASWGSVTSVPVDGSSCMGVRDGSVGASGDDTPGVVSFSAATVGTVTSEPY